MNIVEDTPVVHRIFSFQTGGRTVEVGLFMYVKSEKAWTYIPESCPKCHAQNKWAYHFDNNHNTEAVLCPKCRLLLKKNEKGDLQEYHPLKER
jgi:uncharacterized paraquat-inducible protein A